MTLNYRYLDTPIGKLLLCGDQQGLQRVALPHRHPTIKPDWIADAGALAGAAEQLSAYFAGELDAFHLALSPRGTDFQRRVWAALCDIGYAETCSYGSVARRIGRPTASRAVGAANGRNPIAIVIPCHRVIGADGSLTGYGGGLDVKRTLLAIEARAVAQRSQMARQASSFC